MSYFRSRSILTVLVFLFIALISQSCEKAVADFSFEPMDNPETFETITFFNKSHDAISYEWKFGDGDYSEEDNPEHIYESTGTYKVTLTASGNRESNTSTMYITINDPTVLFLELYEAGKANVIGDCEVWLYDNEYDWLQANRAQIYSYSTFNGKCYFLNLEEQRYYLRAYKYTDTGVWEASAAMSELVLNETTLEKVYFDFTPYEY